MCEENNNAHILNRIKLLRIQAVVSYHPNYGADIAPFLRQIHSVKEPLFIKLHTKKNNILLTDKFIWRKVLYNDFLKNRNIFIANKNKFGHNSAIGMIGNIPLLFRDAEGHNTKHIKRLCGILNIKYQNVANGEFVAGSMFMSKTSIYKRIFNKVATEEILQLLSKEKNKVDDINRGTYSHALERIFGYVIKYKNLQYSYPSYNIVKIKNDLSPLGFFHMVEMYNNDCYLIESINIHGHIIESNTKYKFIKWYHKKYLKTQKYLITTDYIVNTRHIQ